MPYATQDDIIRLYSQNALYVADRDGNGVPEQDAVQSALSMASSEIDSFLGVRYAVPVSPVPDLLVQFAVDMALYRLASSRDMLSDEHRRRYEDAVSHLKQIAAGKAALIIPVDPDAPPAQSGADVEIDATPQPIVAAGPGREFTRAKMQGL
ncbi:MAG: gp436 family protein [Planktomarina sp.]